MRQLPGQAAWLVGRMLHRICTLMLLVAVGGSAVLGGLAWRLSQGPLEMPWVAKRMQDAANADPGPLRVTIGTALLTWEGFTGGVDRPLDIQLRDVIATDPEQDHSIVLPEVNVSLAIGGLLLGRIQPRALDIDGARLMLLRTETGEVRLDFGAPDDAVNEAGPSQLGGLIAELARPPARPGSFDRVDRYSQLRRVRIRNAMFTVNDRKLAVVWRAEAPEIDLRRGPSGGVVGAGSFNLVMGDQRAALQMSGSLSPGDGSINLSAQLSGLAPAVLARQAGSLQALAAVDASLSGSLDLRIGPQRDLQRVALALHAGAGKVTIGPSVVLLAGAELTAEGNDRQLRITGYGLKIVPRAGGPVSTVSGSGVLHREAGRVKGDFAIGVDRVAFADLGLLWPIQAATNAREWIVENITAGNVHDARIQLGVGVNEDLSDPAVTSATGSMLGDGVTVRWMKAVPPVDRGVARLNILDADTLEILISSARQTLDGQRDTGLAIKSGKLHITGIAHKDQFGTIEADIAGPISEAVTLLRSKTLHLFDRVQLELNGASGQVTGKLLVKLPFEQKLEIEQVLIQTKLHLQDAHFTGLVVGRDLDHGNADITGGTDGLKLTGQADVAGIATQVDAEMIFRPGPPNQVVRRITANGRASVRQLTVAGLDVGEPLAGNLAWKAVVTDRRDGTGEVLLSADLADAALTLKAIGWQKPAGQPATAQARLKTRRNRLLGIDDIALDGPGQGDAALLLRAHAAFADGDITGLTIDRMTLGRTVGHGDVRFPAGGRPIEADISGSSIDLSRVLSSKSDPKAPRQDDSKTGQAWTMDARFDRGIMANAITVSDLVAHAENDGRVMRVLHVEAQTGPDAKFRLDIAAPAGARPRTLNASADDAGALLRAVDVLKTMQGGHLTVTGTYDDATNNHALSGTAEINDFRIQGAPALGRLLQAMTLYGLVDVLQGPGLGFSNLVAPFRLTREELALTDSRAFSASLGLTAKGRIDLARDRMDLEGTIVPAYFFNSLLGNLPLIGKIFSPEKGGGLFAAGYTIRGTAADPSVTVNPLSVLTPGFLRGLFGIF